MVFRTSACLAAILLSLALLPASVRAQADEIRAIEVQPTRVCVDQQAVFTVRGTGTCSFVLRFGDGGQQAFTDAALPVSVPHTYTSAQGAPLTARIANVQAPCVDSSSPIPVEFRSICIVAGPDDRTLTWRKKALAYPSIEAVLTFGIEPGAGMMVAGRLFGDAPGRVLLLGTNGTRELEIDSWSPGAISGAVPQDVDAICATGQLAVETTDGVVSEPWNVAVSQEVKKLPVTDLQVLSCGQDGNENHCNDVSFDGDSCVEAYLPPWFIGLETDGRLLGPQGPSAIGFHSNCWGAIGDDSGTDTYHVSLANGWVLDSAQFLASVPEGEGHTDPPSGILPDGFVPGSSTWQPSIDWSVTPGDAVLYNLYIDIRGPACAPHK